MRWAERIPPHDLAVRLTSRAGSCPPENRAARDLARLAIASPGPTRTVGPFKGVFKTLLNDPWLRLRRCHTRPAHDHDCVIIGNNRAVPYAGSGTGCHACGASCPSNEQWGRGMSSSAHAVLSVDVGQGGAGSPDRSVCAGRGQRPSAKAGSVRQARYEVERWTHSRRARGVRGRRPCRPAPLSRELATILRLRRGTAAIAPRFIARQSSIEASSSYYPTRRSHMPTILSQIPTISFGKTATPSGKTAFRPGKVAAEPGQKGCGSRLAGTPGPARVSA